MLYHGGELLTAQPVYARHDRRRQGATAMEIGVGQTRSGEAHTRRSTHRCPQCRTEALVMRRRHVSSPGWGAQTVTEYYDCDYCEAQYTYSPSEDRWKVVTQP
jgi:hypothetical protein